MSLAPREQQTLTAIETQLQLTDPRFADMFRVFDKHGSRSQRHLPVFLAMWLARNGWAAAIMLLATVATLFSTIAVAAAVLA